MVRDHLVGNIRFMVMSDSNKTGQLSMARGRGCDEGQERVRCKKRAAVAVVYCCVYTHREPSSDGDLDIEHNDLSRKMRCHRVGTYLAHKTDPLLTRYSYSDERKSECLDLLSLPIDQVIDGSMLFCCDSQLCVCLT